MSVQASIDRLNLLCERIPALLAQIPEGEFTRQPAPNKWSKKAILGHLIDSATNNHHRFVRAQFETTPAIFYNPDLWNDHSDYLKMDSQHLIQFWTVYNKHLVFLMQNLPEKYLLNEVNTGGSQTVTLEFVINDYVVHLEHHLSAMVDYNF
ncbi:MAG: DinB family protein [Bacteroidota bacterium]